jgi:hypothetical protein
MNFWKLNESLNGGEKDDDQAMQAIRTGQNVSKDSNFWEDFITVTGNADAMSALLGIPKERITGWASKIRSLVAKVEEMDDHTTKKPKHQIINTGKLNI